MKSPRWTPKSPSAGEHSEVAIPICPKVSLVHATLEQLLSSGPVVTDGAWGTQLQSRGLPVGACPDAWNLTRPEAVEAVARAYVEAGSRVILTNTFGANRFILARHDLADRVAEINRAGRGDLAALRASRAKVFASMGPSGVMLMMGEVKRRRPPAPLSRNRPGRWPRPGPTRSSWKP